MVDYNIVTKLKKLRLAKKLTLQSLAREIGFSPALISQIENNNVSPPIATLSKLAKFFNVKMSSFFIENDEEPRFEIIRKDNRKTVSRVISREGKDHGYFFESFSFKKQDKKMEPFLITLNEKMQDDNTYSHEGESFLFVLNGTFGLLLDDRQIILEEGDSVYFNTSLEHRFHSKDGSKVRVLEVCCRN
jgi:transcriptional regulator with XRE-family HTH domain